jgi:nitrogen regulatory protein PII
LIQPIQTSRLGQTIGQYIYTFTRSTAARSGKVGDGKVFVTDVLDAIRIRNEDRGEAAL